MWIGKALEVMSSFQTRQHWLDERQQTARQQQAPNGFFFSNFDLLCGAFDSREQDAFLGQTEKDAHPPMCAQILFQHLEIRLKPIENVACHRSINRS